MQLIYQSINISFINIIKALSFIMVHHPQAASKCHLK